jgi:hypothetical protein
MRCAVSSSRARAVQDALAELVSQALVYILGLRQAVEQFSDRNITRRLCSLAIETCRLILHRFGIFAHRVERKRTNQPQRPGVLHKSFYVLAADQRQVVAELRSIEIEQHRSMLHFLVCHFVEDLGGGGIMVAQPLREALVDAAILLLIGNRKCENFQLAKFAEALHVAFSFNSSIDEMAGSVCTHYFKPIHEM